MNLEKATENFIKYVDDYLKYGENCVLKKNHTMRVMALCKEIASSLNLSEEDEQFAILCGLLHDIGRFEEWKRYQEFSTIDHGKLGVEILQKDHFIKQFLTDETLEPMLYMSIYYHNKYKVPEELSEREKLFCNIVRDADKIDIIHLYRIGDISKEIGNDEFSETIYQSLMNKKQIQLSDRKTKADSVSVPLGFIFDINFPRSIEILRERNDLNEEIDYYQKITNNKVFQEQLETVREKMKEYIKEKI